MTVVDRAVGRVRHVDIAVDGPRPLSNRRRYNGRKVAASKLGRQRVLGVGGGEGRGRAACARRHTARRRHCGGEDRRGCKREMKIGLPEAESSSQSQFDVKLNSPLPLGAQGAERNRRLRSC